MLTSFRNIIVADLLAQDKAAMVYTDGMFWLVADLTPYTKFYHSLILVNGEKTLHVELQNDHAVFIITPDQCSEYGIITD